MKLYAIIDKDEKNENCIVGICSGNTPLPLVSMKLSNMELAMTALKSQNLNPNAKIVVFESVDENEG